MGKWSKLGDRLSRASTLLNLSFPAHAAWNQTGLLTAAQHLAEALLTSALHLARDQTCLDLALARLLSKRPPSQNKQFKDSVILEQYLALVRELRRSGFAERCVFVSSNRTDFADTKASPKIHRDLDPEFQAIRLEYFPTLHAAINSRDPNTNLPLVV
jgi:hypothetical protein